jgi:hypothetical protein
MPIMNHILVTLPIFRLVAMIGVTTVVALVVKKKRA